LLVQPSSFIATLVIIDNDFGGDESEVFSICSSPLSDPINTVIFKTNSRVINGNIISFNSIKSIKSKYIYLKDKTYLAVNYITNIRKDTAPL
jgi:hypothetical protein